MSTSTQALERIETLLSRMLKQMHVLENKIDNALYEDEPAQSEPKQSRPVQPKPVAPESTLPNDISIEDIVKYGKQIGYRRFEGQDAEDLRKFIVYILDHPEEFNSVEVEFAGFANKPQFDDLRLSIHTYRIIEGAYRKKYNRWMTFRYRPGTMYQYGNQLHWVWKEANR